MSDTHTAEVSQLLIAGGVYRERCVWPFWDHIFGSAGRAAAAIGNQVSNVRLLSCMTATVKQQFEPYANSYGFDLEATAATQTISFDYFHTLAAPIITPPIALVERQPDLLAEEASVLRFGMLESSVKVKAARCVYDPQSAFAPEEFGKNGSVADELAIVGNTAEIASLTRSKSAVEGARNLVAQGGAALVVVKAGPEGALLLEKSKETFIPAYRTSSVWTLGTGDVFAAVFAARWASLREDPVSAARAASRAVAEYVQTISLPVSDPTTLRAQSPEAIKIQRGKVYIASPFFSLGQRWLVDEARNYLTRFGMEVFSPVHDVGPGPAEVVAPADLIGINECNVMFAVLDGLDPGTLFEVGYAQARGIPVYALAQSVSEENLKMFKGSGCKIYGDFVTLLYHLVWRA